MLDKRIIFQNNEGGVSIISPNYDGGYTVKDALAAVPSGKAYKIIDATEIPSDRSQRMAWSVDPDDLTDGVGA